MDLTPTSARSDRFVGRTTSLALVDRSLEESLVGCPRAVFIQGEAGIGKSRLVAVVLDRARRRGAAVLYGRCGEDLDVPYFPLATALAPLGDDLGVAIELLDPPSPAASSVDPTSALEVRSAAPLVAACRAAIRAARRRPLVLVIEDLHWADKHTAELFEQLVSTAFHAGTMAPTALLVLSTMRAPEGHVRRIVDRLCREDATRSIELTGMSELEINELVMTLAPARPSRALLSAIVDATGGNPLLVRTVLDRLVRGGQVEVRSAELVSAAGELLLPGIDLDSELGRRLERVNAQCRQLLTTAAFLGDGARLDDLELITTVGFDDLWQEAEAAGLVHDDGQRYHFDHPQLRQLLYHAPGGRRRQRLHLALADALDARHGGDSRRSIEIADHLRRSGGGADRRRLARTCLAAAEQAFAMAAWGTAARFFDEALAADPPADPRARGRLALRAGVGHFRDHDLATAEVRLTEAITDARSAEDIETWAVAAMLLTRARITIGTTSVGAGADAATLQEVLQAPELDPRLAGQIVSLMAEASFNAFDFDGGRSLLAEARRLARANGDDALMTNVEMAFGLQHLGRLELHDAAESFQASATHAQRLADPWQRVWGLGRLPLVELARGDLAAAKVHADEAARVAAANHDWAEHALASACTMQVLTGRGEFFSAESAGALAQQMYRRSDYAMVPALIYPAFAAVRALRGDVDGANEALDELVACGVRGIAPYRLLVVAASMDRGELVATRPFRPVGGRPIHLFTLPILCAQVDVADALGDVDLLADAFDPIVAQHRAGVRWCVGWPLLLARLITTAARGLGRLDDAATWSTVAAREAAAAGAAGEAARVDLERAKLAMARGDESGGCQLAGRAALVFDRLGMLPLHQHALRLAGDPPGHQRIVRTVLFTDLVGSTATNVRRGDDAYVELLDRHNAILRNRLRQFDGVEIKHTGDGLCSWFVSATSACECALAARRDLAEHTALHPDAPLHVRFGIASGSPIPRQGDLFGVSVSLAARLCDQAAPGQVVVSTEVMAAIEGTRLSGRALEPLELKGFPEPVAAFAVGVTSS